MVHPTKRTPFYFQIYNEPTWKREISRFYDFLVFENHLHFNSITSSLEKKNKQSIVLFTSNFNLIGILITHRFIQYIKNGIVRTHRFNQYIKNKNDLHWWTFQYTKRSIKRLFKNLRAPSISVDEFRWYFQGVIRNLRNWINQSYYLLSQYNWKY